MRVVRPRTLAIEVDGAPLESGPRAQRKSLDLLKVLIAHGPAPVDAAVVLDALWPDADGAAARAAFDMAVMRLRKLLGRHEALRLDASRIGLDTQQVWVDAFAFAQGATDDYPGPLFGTDAVQPWSAAARERLHQRFLRRALERARALEARGEFDAALAIYESWPGAGSAGRGSLPGRDPLPPRGRTQCRRPARIPPLPRTAVDRARCRAFSGDASADRLGTRLSTRLSARFGAPVGPPARPARRQRPATVFVMRVPMATSSLRGIGWMVVCTETW